MSMDPGPPVLFPARSGLAGDREDPWRIHRLRHACGQEQRGWDILILVTSQPAISPYEISQRTVRTWMSSSSPSPPGTPQNNVVFEIGSSSGTRKWAKIIKAWTKCWGLCDTGGWTKSDPAYGTLYICTDIVRGNKITAVSSGMASFPCPHHQTCWDFYYFRAY